MICDDILSNASICYTVSRATTEAHNGLISLYLVLKYWIKHVIDMILFYFL